MRLRTVLLAFLLCGFPLRTSAAPDPTYAALRAARPDGRTVPVTNLQLERDAFRFQFDSGAFHFLAPVEGRTVGAVFVGKGSYRLIPATENERRALGLASGADKGFETLTDEFDSLVLLFADDTAQEIEIHAPVQKGSPDARAAQAYEAALKHQKKDFQINFHVRVLADLLNTPGLMSGVFLALIDGKKYPPVLASVDPRGAEALGMGALLGGEDTMLLVADPNRGGIWYLSDRRHEVDRGRSTPFKPLADALHYQVDTLVERDTDITGTTTVRFKALTPGLRVIPIELLPDLRIQEASFSLEAAGAEPAWKPAAFVQEDREEDATAAVILPEPLAKDAVALLRVSYKGDQVLTDAGDKNFVVEARTSWYANLGIFIDPADFDLTYRVPAGNEIISVGRRIEDRTEGKQAVSVWKTEHPIRVAGFNYGKFKKLEKQDEVSKIDVQVYTNPGTPDIIREINAALSSASEQVFYDEDGFPITEAAGGGLGNINTSRLAESSLTDGLNAARLFTAYFGPLPQTHVAITQQSQELFGQSWPSLIFMPYVSFLDGTQRQRLGLAQAKDFVDQVGHHEFAHQWWGHLVGWDSYRDTWLSEGFSEFSSALAVQHTRGWAEYDRFWREARKGILAKYPGNTVANWEAGPITLGQRLFTQRSPSAYQAMVYSKGGYVLHMLRTMMYDPASRDPDAKFIEMMKDFTSTYAGKHPSTGDFQKVVERHMLPAMNATGDGKMDWFFRQWVHGTEIPRYTHNLKVEAVGEETRIAGTVRQEGVSKDFRALVPLYVELSKTETARVALVPMAGESSQAVDLKVKLPKKARRALVNARGEILARD